MRLLRVAPSLLVATFTFAVVAAQAPTPQSATQAQQRPVFRGGTHFVRVDAYPTNQDGRIVEGLTADDFEIFEDGKPQKVDSFDFVKFETFTPDVERRDPSSQQEGFDKAADPRYRVFVIFVDLVFANASAGAVVPNRYDLHFIQQPLVNFLKRVLGPQDLFGFLTSRNSVKDLVLGQKSLVIETQVQDLLRTSIIDRDDADQLDGCLKGPSLKPRHRADQTYTALEGLVAQLGSLRQERKNVVFVTNYITRALPDRALLDANGGLMPRVGITQGRITSGERDPGVMSNDAYCAGEAQRLAMMDFDSRYRQLLAQARKENVAFYPITPGGLQAPVTVQGMDAVKSATDDLISLAHETDGIPIVNTNDLNGGMKRIADDLAAYYVLGYYTTNTKFDGNIRNIKVRLKSSGKQIRARRQYRAPTEAEIAALTSGVGSSSSAAPGVPLPPSPYETALVALERASRPFALYTAAAAGKQVTVVTELSAASIAAGKWKDGADLDVAAVSADGAPLATARGKIEPGAYSTSITLPPLRAPAARVTVRLKGSDGPSVDDWIKIPPATGTLVGDAVAYRTGPRAPTRPVATFEYARNERIRVEWSTFAPLDRREVRLLDKTGRPLPVELPLSEDAAKSAVVVEMSLSGLVHGDYMFELTAGAGGVTEKRLLAIRIK